MVILGKKYDFCFIHIPKTGGSSVTRWIAWLEGLGGPNGEPNGWQTIYHKIRGSMHEPHPDIPKGYQAFCIVRDPVDRLVSWANMLEIEPSLFERWARSVMKGKAEKPPMELQVPQHHYFEDNDATILIFDKLEEQLFWFFSELGVDKEDMPEFPHCQKGDKNMPTPTVSAKLWRDIVAWDYQAAKIIHSWNRSDAHNLRQID